MSNVVEVKTSVDLIELMDRLHEAEDDIFELKQDTEKSVANLEQSILDERETRALVLPATHTIRTMGVSFNRHAGAQV